MVSSDYFLDILLSSPAEHTSGSPYQKLNPHKAGSLPPQSNSFIACPSKYRFVTHMISYFFFNYIHLILIYCLSTCFCNQHPVNLLLHCFLCIFIEMITDNIDCLPDFLCKCVTLCFCIHHFFHNHFSFLLEPQQRVIPLVSVRTLFFKSGPKWALPVSQATYI